LLCAIFFDNFIAVMSLLLNFIFDSFESRAFFLKEFLSF
jgi:hypothetical protein